MWSAAARSPADIPGNRPTTRSTRRCGPVSPISPVIRLERRSRPCNDRPEEIHELEYIGEIGEVDLPAIGPKGILRAQSIVAVARAMPIDDACAMES
jgi:hypothetical protein